MGTVRSPMDGLCWRHQVRCYEGNAIDFAVMSETKSVADTVFGVWSVIYYRCTFAVPTSFYSCALYPWRTLVLRPYPHVSFPLGALYVFMRYARGVLLHVCILNTHHAEERGSILPTSRFSRITLKTVQHMDIQFYVLYSTSIWHQPRKLWKCDHYLLRKLRFLRDYAPFSGQICWVFKQSQKFVLKQNAH